MRGDTITHQQISTAHRPHVVMMTLYQIFAGAGFTAKCLGFCTLVGPVCACYIPIKKQQQQQLVTCWNKVTEINQISDSTLLPQQYYQ